MLYNEVNNDNYEKSLIIEKLFRYYFRTKLKLVINFGMIFTHDELELD